MAEVAISSQLQQWTFAKSIGRPERADSAACSPEIFTAEGLDLPVKTERTPTLDSTEPIFQDRYLSSEEDLSPMEPDFDTSDFDDDDEIVEVVEATAVAAPMAAQRPKSGDRAVTVSYVSAGRPKIVTVPTAPILKERPSRTTSLAASPVPELAMLGRMSISSTSNVDSPRPSKDSIRRRSISFGKTSSFGTQDSSIEAFPRESTPSVSSLRRPSTSKSFAHYTQAARKSIHLLSHKSSTHFDNANIASPTSNGPSFLNSDPFSEGSTNAASPTIKSGNGHKRLRSISRSLAIAKIAIKPRTTPNTPNTEPPSPFTLNSPRTPMTPEHPRSSQSNRRRLVPRESISAPSAEARPMSPTVLQKQRPKLVPRGANERAPPIELPPFPIDEPEPSPKSKDTFFAPPANRMSKLKKRKSILGLSTA